MKETKTSVDIKKKEVINTPNPGANIRFFRKKKGTSQNDLADALNIAIKQLNRDKLQGDLIRDYDLWKDKDIKQQQISEWEKGETEIPKIIIFLAAQYLKLDTEWLTDYVFEMFEGTGFVQTGGNSYNNWHTIHNIEVNNDPDPIVKGFKELIQNQKEFYENELIKTE